MKRERLIVLDALRAMAGLTVPLFHICENLGYPPLRYESVCGHGYLAVEFFLLLMGYMLAYAGKTSRDLLQHVSRPESPPMAREQ